MHGRWERGGSRCAAEENGTALIFVGDPELWMWPFVRSTRPIHLRHGRSIRPAFFFRQSSDDTVFDFSRRHRGASLGVILCQLPFCTATYLSMPGVTASNFRITINFVTGVLWLTNGILHGARVRIVRETCPMISNGTVCDNTAGFRG